jgi:hypothetical protein
MSELLQDVQFHSSDTKEETNRKLRILQDEMIRLSRVLAIFSVSDTGVIDLGQLPMVVAAGAPLGYLSVTVNGVEGRLAVLLP